MIRWYKNSFLASVVSILGCTLILAGIMIVVEEEELAGGIMLAIVGLALAIWGKNISENKAFKKWWQQVIDNNLEGKIGSDRDLQQEPPEAHIKEDRRPEPRRRRQHRKIPGRKEKQEITWWAFFHCEKGSGIAAPFSCR